MTALALGGVAGSGPALRGVAGSGLAEALADWAHRLAPDHDDPAAPGHPAGGGPPGRRPISALAGLAQGLAPGDVRRIVLRTPEATVAPLIHHRPDTGLQAKFSLEYAAAAALLDGYPGFASFTDEAVRRPAARRLTGLVETKLDPGGSWLLDGELAAWIHTGDGVLETTLRYPPGAPQRPPSQAQLTAKISDCVAGLDTEPAAWTWQNAAQVLAHGLVD